MTADTPSTLEAQSQAQPPPTTAYSAFTTSQKRFIITMISLASLFSPLSGQIYYPVMPTLVQNYHLTPALINLTITTYMILQGLAPSFMGTFADTGGRRPAYIVAFTIYTAANIGLALQNSYAALMILRCIQSAGSSGTIAFGYGVIADIATPAERGHYIGPMAAGVMIAPAIGPVVGGLLSRYLGWRAVFWFLVVVSGGYLVVFVLVVPETGRVVVGDGGVVPAEWWRMSVWQWVTARRRRSPPSSGGSMVEGGAGGGGGGPETTRGDDRCPRKLAFPNPLPAFAILLEMDALIIISFVGLAMLANVALLTSTPTLFGKLYGLNVLQIGLCFLPLGVGACIGAILNGKLLDLNYRRTAHRLGITVDRKKGEDLRRFPIEQTRLQTFFPIMALATLTFLPYGWVLQRRAHLAVPLILQFIMGFSFIAALNTLNTLLVDLFPDRAATASAACNLVRCWLGAVGAAVIDYMLNGMGWGWCFTFLGLVLAAGLGLMWVEYKRGMGWREKRFLKRNPNPPPDDIHMDDIGEGREGLGEDDTHGEIRVVYEVGQ
ncbi:putative MFS transporter [Aspergillus campestris IBT 28561]|uniref:MFS transporter n=1 Tax=Aspergillus campestris (strain IBT 28561) TaxID=1392248 RepID=A0A2I1CYA4_ASPC2|nr:putative MFS transporter [Aspergillus campestris IBT 28561]PKY02610.1 putative MFS transporter [Aspergillus campestris IBT 28561]